MSHPFPAPQMFPQHTPECSKTPKHTTRAPPKTDSFPGPRSNSKEPPCAFRLPYRSTCVMIRASLERNIQRRSHDPTSEVRQADGVDVFSSRTNPQPTRSQLSAERYTYHPTFLVLWHAEQKTPRRGVPRPTDPPLPSSTVEPQIRTTALPSLWHPLLCSGQAQQSLNTMHQERIARAPRQFLALDGPCAGGRDSRSL